MEARRVPAAALYGGRVRWTVSNPTPATDDEAARRGLTHRRDVLQLRCPLPLPTAAGDQHPVVETRAFVPGSADEGAWLDTNNRAFAGHPDQAHFTLERLHGLLAEHWFDADGFRLHERDGRLAAFCWTKVHPPTADDPELGEIFVIGVDPEFQGLGLGRGLTEAGLAWLASRGVATGMLYVDASNTAARALYDRLGFVLHHVDRLYEPDHHARTVS
jgi:mycothiol synthase